MRRVLVVVCLVALVAVGFWRFRSRGGSREEAYIRDRSVTLWSRLAQVREPVAVLRYGERVAIVQRKNAQVQVRTAQGETGWVDERHLMEAELWHRANQLLEQARPIPVQGRGHTRVLTNVRAEPGRAGPRIYQFGRGVPVEVLGRATAEWSSLAEEAQMPAKETQAQPAELHPQRREDWLLVRGSSEEAGEVAGWVLRRFVELDLPEPLRDYAAGIRFVAWFELNRVLDGGEERPEYLAVGAKGGEGQACDFTLLRVYTWSTKRKRYETAYVESALCGRLPIRLTQQASLSVFRFAATGRKGDEEREYRMRQNIVRRVRGTK